VKCHDCGLAEDLEWAYAKDGKPYLVQIRRVPHFALCSAKKGSKNGQKPARKAKAAVNPAIRDAQAGLMSQGYKSRQVQGMLAELPAEILETADAETLIREVFKRRAAELAKKGAG
jgi:hypothetical protein